MYQFISEIVLSHCRLDYIIVDSDTIVAVYVTRIRTTMLCPIENL